MVSEIKEASATDLDIAFLDQSITNLFALVGEAVAGATHALLNSEPRTGQAIVDADRSIDELTCALDRDVWAHIETQSRPKNLRYLVAVLLILPELERSADLAEHIAQRAVKHLGTEMSPSSRGIVQRMSEVALSMWHTATDAYADRAPDGAGLDEADEEMDALHERLTEEVATGAMSPAVAAQVTLLARFYERLGDHAVNLAKRIASIATS